MSWDESTPSGAPDVQADPAGLDEYLRLRAAAAVAGRPPSVDTDPWRQAFHVQPPVGLLNDPNGLVQHRGTYHLCFQWHPFAAAHGLKLWAHLTSTDLVHWTEQPPALVPSQPYDRNGCYSGSGFVHEDAVRFAYTGNVRGPAGERESYQALATLDPMGRVIRHRANPLVAALPGCTAHVRDPKVWAQDGSWWMVLGAQTEDLHGTVLLLRSDDLLDWHLVGPVGGGATEPHGYMWECPDLLRLDGRDVLVISPQFDNGEEAGAGRFVDVTEYRVGRLDHATGRLTGTDFRRVDAGPDFYAPQTFVDAAGRTIMVGWMGMPDHPGHPDLAVKHPTVANGWVHCLTVPREVRLDGDTLVAVPVAELAALRGRPTALTAATIGAGATLVADGFAGTALDVELSVGCPPGGTLEVRLRDGAAGRPVVLAVDPHAGTATLDRTRLGTGEGGVHTGRFRPGPAVDVRILLDHSSVEVFVDGGRLVLSARIYPVAGDVDVVLAAHGAPATVDVSAWPMDGAGQ